MVAGSLSTLLSTLIVYWLVVDGDWALLGFPFNLRTSIESILITLLLMTFFYLGNISLYAY